MSWNVVTGDLADGTAQFVTALESQLTAHPAWEFVENVTETYDQEVTGGTYAAETFTIRVWKCLGTVNSLGQDFFAAIITIQTFTPTGTDPLVGYGGDRGDVMLMVFEQYDAAENRHIRPAGLYWAFGNPTFTLDPTTKSVRGNEAFHFFKSKISDDGLSWGRWGNWPQPIATVPANLNDTSFNDASGFAILYGASTSNDPGFTPPTGATTLRTRVTNDGIFASAEQELEFGTFRHYQTYAGLGDDSARPAPLQSPFPLVFTPVIGPGDTTGVVSQSRFPEASSAVTLSAPPTGTMNFNDSGLRPATAATDRTGWPYPALTPYVFAHAGLQSMSVAIGPRSGSTRISWDPGIRLPGIYHASTGGAGTSGFAQFDTILSPEGNTCIIIANDYPGSEGSSTDWFAIDTEIE